MKKFPAFPLATVLLVASMVVGLSVSAFAQSYTVQIATAPNGLKYLTDSKGMTLYYFTRDVNGKSVCAGGCAKLWPPFYAPSVDVPAALNGGAFGTTVRADGTSQTTYNGWPLYYFAGDKKPGQMRGQDFRHVWFVETIPAYTVMLATSSKLGNYLTDASGDTLYYFKRDSVDTTACVGGCAKVWPPFYASHIVAPAGVNPADFGTMTRPDGSEQTTFKGYPLYRWFHDKTRGETTGEGVAGSWFVVNPANFHPGA